MFNYLKVFLFRENSLRGASWILVITLAFSNLLGVVRDHFLTQYLPTERLDIYYAAFRLPDLVFNLLILGAIAAAVIPVLSRELKKNEAEAWRAASNLINVGLVILVVILGLLYLLLPIILPVIFAEFDTAKIQETITLGRWMLLSPLFFATSYFLGSILNIKKRFTIYALAPLFYNAAIIAATILGAERWGIRAPVAGVILGAFLHMVIQAPAVWALGFRPRPILSFKDPVVYRIYRLMLPRSLALGANQLQLLVFTIFASVIPGAIAVYNLADNIQTVPTVILGNSLATATFPRLAHLYDDNKDAFRGLLIKTIRLILVLIVPGTVGLFLLRAQVVRLILGYGEFGWSDTRAVVDTVGLFALGIVAQGLLPLLSRAFYALEDSFFPMKVTLWSVVVGIAGGYVGLQYLGVAGLALGFSIAGWVSCLWLLWELEKRVALRLGDVFWGVIGKVLFLTITMAFLMQVSKMMMAHFVDIDTVFGLLAQTVAAICVGVFYYLGGAWLWRVPEIRK